MLSAKAEQSITQNNPDILQAEVHISLKYKGRVELFHTAFCVDGWRYIDFSGSKENIKNEYLWIYPRTLYRVRV